MRHYLLPLILLLSMILISVSDGNGTILPNLSTHDLVQRADVIIKGKVLDRECYWANNMRHIMTKIRIQVLEVLKGSPPDEIFLIQAGGRIGTYDMSVTGNAKLENGEEVLLFLRVDEKFPKVHYLVGMVLGKYSVIEKDGKTVVTRNVGMIPILGTNGQVQPYDPSDDRLYEDMKTEILNDIKALKK